MALSHSLNLYYWYEQIKCAVQQKSAFTVVTSILFKLLPPQHWFWQTVCVCCRPPLLSDKWLKRWMMLCSCCALRYVSCNPQLYSVCLHIYTPLNCVLQLKRTIVSVALWDGELTAVHSKWVALWIYTVSEADKAMDSFYSVLFAGCVHVRARPTKENWGCTGPYWLRLCRFVLVNFAVMIGPFLSVIFGQTPFPGVPGWADGAEALVQWQRWLHCHSAGRSFHHRSIIFYSELHSETQQLHSQTVIKM